MDRWAIPKIELSAAKVKALEHSATTTTEAGESGAPRYYVGNNSRGKKPTILFQAARMPLHAGQDALPKAQSAASLAAAMAAAAPEVGRSSSSNGANQNALSPKNCGAASAVEQALRDAGAATADRLMQKLQAAGWTDPATSTAATKRVSALVVLVGPQCIGKSTTAKQLVAQCGMVSCSADTHMKELGEFDFRKLGECHKASAEIKETPAFRMCSRSPMKGAVLRHPAKLASPAIGGLRGGIFGCCVFGCCFFLFIITAC